MLAESNVLRSQLSQAGQSALQKERVMLRFILISLLLVSAAPVEATLPGNVARPEIVLRAQPGDRPGEIGFPREAGYGFPSEGPSGLAVDEKNRLFILDMIHARILCYDPAGTLRLTLPLPGDSGDYFPDFLVHGGLFTLLNQTARSLYILDSQGQSRVQQSLRETLSLPARLGISVEGNLFIQDDEQRIVMVRPSGISNPLIQDGSFSPFADADGRLLGFADDESNGVDLLGIDPSGEPLIKRIGRLPRMRLDCQLMERSVIGVDTAGRIYVRLIEKRSNQPEEENVEIFYFRFNPDGRISGLLRTLPLPRIRSFPEREETVSPSGDIYLMASDEGYSEFRIIRYRFDK